MSLILFLCLITYCECFIKEATYVLNFESPVYVVGEGSSQYVDSSRMICERYNESTSFMHGEIEFLKEMDLLILNVLLKKEASGKHEVLFAHDICDFCDELGNKEGNYHKYLQYIGIPESCPFDAGSYEIKNLIVDVDEFEIKDQQCGLYMAELSMYKRTGDSCSDRDLLFTLCLEFSIERQG